MGTDDAAEEAEPATPPFAESHTGLGPAHARSSYRPPAAGYNRDILHDDDALALALEEETRRLAPAPARTPSEVVDIGDEELVRMITEDMAAHGSTIGAIEQLEEVLAVRAATAGIPIQSAEPTMTDAALPDSVPPDSALPSFDAVIAQRDTEPRDTSVRRARTVWIWLAAVLVVLAVAAAVAVFGFGLGR